MREVYILLLTALFFLNSCAGGPIRISPDITVINKKYNEIEYVPDDPFLGHDDWKQPSRFMEEGGDCEDFAIAKYWELIEDHHVAILAGIVTFPANTPGYHAVLLVDKMWVLDNNFDEIISLAEYIQLFDFKIMEIVDHRRFPKLMFAP